MDARKLTAALRELDFDSELRMNKVAAEVMRSEPARGDA